MTVSAIYATYYKSPVADLLLAHRDNALCLALFVNDKTQTTLEKTALAYNLRVIYRQTDFLDKAAAQLDEYFSATRTVFDIKLEHRLSAFTAEVLEHTAKIAYGSSVTYSDLAKMVGGANYARAAAQALSRNTLNIFIPCHRVIASQGKIGGYQGGSHIKRFLLDLEQKSLVNLKNMT